MFMVGSGWRMPATCGWLPQVGVGIIPAGLSAPLPWQLPVDSTHVVDRPIAWNVGNAVDQECVLRYIAAGRSRFWQTYGLRNGRSGGRGSVCAADSCWGYLRSMPELLNSTYPMLLPNSPAQSCVGISGSGNRRGR